MHTGFEFTNKYPKLLHSWVCLSVCMCVYLCVCVCKFCGNLESILQYILE